MIKYFHELTEEEFNALCDDKMTWGECAKEYSQPEWCGYPEAVQGRWGCSALMCLMVTGRNFCRGCGCYIQKAKKIKGGTNGLET